MCKFCVEHGEGERWYLQAKNYAYDLNSDLDRREYITHFVSGFPEMRSNVLAWMDRFELLPAPLSRAGKALISRRQQDIHYGQPVPLEECEQILDIATSITAIPCICRMHEPGKKADQVCMLVTTQPVDALLAEGFRDYKDGPDLDDFNRLDKESAMALLRRCEEDGLMHSIWTFKTPFSAAICNCNVESGCMAMKLTSRYDLKMMWRGESVAVLDAQRCTNCGRCARVCPFGAIQTSSGRVNLRATECWGCGICRSACRNDALSLTARANIPEVARLW